MATKTPKPGDTVELPVGEIQPNPWNPNVGPLGSRWKKQKRSASGSGAKRTP